MRRATVLGIGALVLALALAGCKPKQAAPPATPAAPENGAASAVAPPPAPSADEGLPMPPKDQMTFLGETTTVIDAPGPRGKPPDLPTADWVDNFVRKMNDAINNLDARFLLERMAPGAKIQLSLGAKTQTMDAREWYARAMTGMHAVERYKYEIRDRKYAIQGAKVALQLWIHEEYDREGKTVKDSTYQTMDLEWVPKTGDFLVRSMIAEVSEVAEN